jgi:hypothetical protein
MYPGMIQTNPNLVSLFSIFSLEEQFMNFLIHSLVSYIACFFVCSWYLLMVLVKFGVLLLQVMFLHLGNLDLWP